MKSLVVLAHPSPKSFNAQLAETACNILQSDENSCSLYDLYQMEFDPLERERHYHNRKNNDKFDVQGEQRHASDTDTLEEDVKRQIEAVEGVDILILQYPMWWYMPPAILKGWLDRVMVYGRTYTSKRRYDTGMFKGKKAMLSVTTGALEDTFMYDGRNGDIELLLWPLNFTLNYLGFTVLKPSICFGVEGGLKYSQENDAICRLKQYHNDFEDILKEIEKREEIRFNGWKDWDEKGRLLPEAKTFSPFMRRHK